MTTPHQLQPAKPVNAFNAVDRYQMVKTVLDNCQRWLTPLESYAHPALFDLFVHYRLLVASVDECGKKFKSSNVKRLSSRDFIALNKLESLVHSYQETVKDAFNDLTNQG